MAINAQLLLSKECSVACSEVDGGISLIAVYLPMIALSVKSSAGKQEKCRMQGWLVLSLGVTAQTPAKSYEIGKIYDV